VPDSRLPSPPFNIACDGVWPQASENDRFVALQLLKNANIAAARVLPSCQVCVCILLFCPPLP
jgi:hypothetical protein